MAGKMACDAGDEPPVRGRYWEEGNCVRSNRAAMPAGTASGRAGVRQEGQDLVF